MNNLTYEAAIAEAISTIPLNSKRPRAGALKQIAKKHDLHPAKVRGDIARACRERAKKAYRRA